ncbi:DUF835 domain-containing protein [Thermococcus waiotapuensis]|uniref:DUF835 domain-containing protein n=1 Tax=Thermococcus waiotapuensis TaxID=90909 RepID=A0AAE4T2U3_9EURY|nr:DUF835 domain-containing protein [Thermococcus waiotapuensis]MDV3103163.1 DUF835 domain-containing protein [Thermococcus waiotapuensis]
MLPIRSLVALIGQLFSVSIPLQTYHAHPTPVEIVRSRGQVREPKVLTIGRPGAPLEGDAIFVSSLPGFVGPRELPRLLHVLISHLQENPDVPVVVECLEYLALHNGFESLLKFLNTLRDYAILHGGKVYLVTDPSAWTEREYALLERLTF